jgi:hypothetical protein
MGCLSKVQSLWVLMGYCCFSLPFCIPTYVQAARAAQVPDVSGAPSRMVFKENTKNSKEPSCQLTLMHVYTSKFNKKFTQFAFTGSVVAKRKAGQPMVLSVIGQNHQLSSSRKDIQPSPIPRIELGLEDVSVRRFTGHRTSCKKNSVCVEYKDTPKNELQTWVGDEAKNLHLLFPLMTKQAPVVIDLSKLLSGTGSKPPLAQFKSCTAHLN